MSIRIIVNTTDNDGAPVADTKSIRRFEKHRILIGSESGCDICLEGLPGVGLSIFKDENKQFVLEKNDEAIAVRVNDDPLTAKTTVIWNGDLIFLDGYRLRFILEFQRAQFHRKTGVAAFLSTALIVGIVILESGLILAIPKQLEKRQLWGEEIVQQRMVHLLDSLRIRCTNIHEDKNDRLAAATVKLIESELNELAGSLRDRLSEVPIDQLKLVEKDLKFYENLLDQLENGTLYGKPVTIDTESVLRKLIVEHNSSTMVKE